MIYDRAECEMRLLPVFGPRGGLADSTGLENEIATRDSGWQSHNSALLFAYCMPFNICMIGSVPKADQLENKRFAPLVKAIP